MVHSVRDDQLAGRWVRVSDAAVGSFAVVRAIGLQPAARWSSGRQINRRCIRDGHLTHASETSHNYMDFVLI